MKKSISKILGLAVLSAVTLMSCQSNKAVAEVDEYAGSEEEQEETETEESTRKTTLTENNFSWASLLGQDKFTEIDSMELNTATVTFGIKKQAATIVYHNKAKKLGFGSPYMAAYYYVTFDKDGCEKLQKAVETYLNDFENKNLSRKEKNTHRKYATTTSRLDWGSIKQSVSNSSASAQTFFGYKFFNKSPYFTISVSPAVNQKRLDGDDTAMEQSLNLNYYLTKAEATQLAEMLSEENLENYMNLQNKKNAADAPDEY